MTLQSIYIIYDQILLLLQWFKVKDLCGFSSPKAIAWMRVFLVLPLSKKFHPVSDQLSEVKKKKH